MKSRFLDVQNCHELLPKGNDLPLLARLEECLHAINDRPGDLKGSIDSLIKRNERTSIKIPGSKRLCISPVEISQSTNLQQRIVPTIPVAKRFPGPALFHTFLGYENGMAHKTIVPLQYLLKGWGDASNGYQCYIHTISHNVINIRSFEELFRRNMTDKDNYYYVGITSRNWLQRLEEHVREMRQGNRRLFYQMWREKYGMANVLFTSYLKDINLTFEDAMNWEEKYVDKIASDQYGLNMIPGGFKGLQVLHKLRIIDHMNISLEERERAIAEYVRRNPRKGVPNPFIAELWKNEEYYLKVIEGRKKSLSSDQVRKIRELNKGNRTIKQIAQEVNALNELQVKNVILGKTYRRIV